MLKHLRVWGQAERHILQALHFAIPRDSIAVQLDLMALAVSQYVTE